MCFKPINRSDLLFSCSIEGNPDFIKKNHLEHFAQDVLNVIFNEIKKTNIKNDDIKSMSINNNRIICYVNCSAKEYVLDITDNSIHAKVSLLGDRCLKFERDIVGEKILKVSKNDQFNRLYLFSSGGGGHKSAKEAEMERDFKQLMDHVTSEIRKESGSLYITFKVNPGDLEREGTSLIGDERLRDPAKFAEWCREMGLVKDVDVLNDYLGRVGVWASGQWDDAQRAGDVKKQEDLASKQWLSDLFFGPVIFISTLRSLIQFKPKQVVSTQAMATPAILLAIRLYNLFFRPKEDLEVKLHLYMTDMPTDYAKHFFDSIKKISEIGGKKFLVLHAPKIETGSWEALCGLSKEQVCELDVKDLPVRLDFLRAVDAFQFDPNHPSVEIKVGEKEEMQLLHRVLKHQANEGQELGNREKEGTQFINYQMNPEDKGTFLMLGSQPTKSAVEDYIQEYLKLARESKGTNYHLFAFAGKFDKDKDCFYKQLVAYIENQPEWPPNLRVIPLSYQAPKQLVSLELMCDTITRSGGATVMELLVLNEVNKKSPDLILRRRFIHAQLIEGRTLEESIALWEKGNFLFLKEKIGAKVVDPACIKDAIFG